MMNEEEILQDSHWPNWSLKFAASMGEGRTLDTGLDNDRDVKILSSVETFGCKAARTRENCILYIEVLCLRHQRCTCSVMDL